MSSLSIVIRFDVFEYSKCGDSPRDIFFAVNELDFQGVEKTLHRSIVVTVRPASHTAAQPVTFNQSLIAL